MHRSQLVTPTVGMAANSRPQTMGPGVFAGVDPITTLDIEREKNKIARFLTTKERSGVRFLEREAKAEARLQQIEKQNLEFEKRKKTERKIIAERNKEKKDEVKQKLERLL